MRRRSRRIAAKEPPLAAVLLAEAGEGDSSGELLQRRKAPGEGRRELAVSADLGR